MQVSGKKQKRISLLIEAKVNIIKLIESGTSYTIISEWYSIGRSIVCNINKNKESLKDFSYKMTEMDVKKEKTMKVGVMKS